MCVSDVGLYEASGGGGYDTHTANARDTATNFDNLLASLLAMINAPGEGDLTKLSLDDTLIILNTEFGRTPFFTAAEFEANLPLLRQEIPAALWADLREKGLLHPEAPTPS